MTQKNFDQTSWQKRPETPAGQTQSEISPEIQAEKRPNWSTQIADYLTGLKNLFKKPSENFLDAYNKIEESLGEGEQPTTEEIEATTTALLQQVETTPLAPEQKNLLQKFRNLPKTIKTSLYGLITLAELFAAGMVYAEQSSAVAEAATPDTNTPKIGLIDATKNFSMTLKRQLKSSTKLWIRFLTWMSVLVNIKST